MHELEMSSPSLMVSISPGWNWVQSFLKAAFAIQRSHVRRGRATAANAANPSGRQQLSPTPDVSFMLINHLGLGPERQNSCFSSASSRGELEQDW